MAEVNSNNRKSPALKLVVVVAVLVGAAGLYFQVSKSSTNSERVTFAVQRGDLRVTVLVGGRVAAQQSQEIKSEIRGRDGAKILSIIEEGYLVTQEDIDNGLILVELDPAELKDELVNQEIALQGAEATYIQQKAQYEIQLNQNQRNVSEAQLTVKFARMDFEKFLGVTSVKEIVELLELEERFAEKPPVVKTEIPKPTVATRPEGERRRGSRPDGEQGQARPERPSGEGAATRQGRPQGGSGGAGGGGRGFSPERMKQMIADNGGELPDFIKDRLPDMGMTEEQFMEQINGGDAGGRPQPVEQPAAVEPLPTDIAVTLDAEYLELRNSINFSKYANVNTLEDGSAKQMLSTLRADELVAQEDKRLAETRVEGQERLREKDFITVNDLELEKVKYQKAIIRVDTAEMEQELYIKYTFPKEAEKLFFDYESALMGLVRMRKEGEAKMAQENAQLKAAERKYKLAQDEFANLETQIEKCTIRAERPGLVVYGSSTDSNPFRRSSEEPIAEGTTVRERQRIITIPDTTYMGVKVNIHESAVKRVQVGQSVSISIDAFPEQLLQGKVAKVAVLADSANSFMNPDLKVYPTVIHIDGTYDWLRPGMSAEVEVLIDELNDVLFIPIQAVTYEGDIQVCYVLKNGNPVKRTVKLGSFTEEFIEITDGLSEGEEVLLLVPGGDLADEEDAPESEDSEITQ